MLTVGQELWFVPSDKRYVGQSRMATVVKVGRKWAHIDREGYRINQETLWADGGQYVSPGRCWLNKEDWKTYERTVAVWRDFQSRLSYDPPSGVTIETIEKIKGLLDQSR